MHNRLYAQGIGDFVIDSRSVPGNPLIWVDPLG
jgi:hypothetical protein